MNITQREKWEQFSRGTRNNKPFDIENYDEHQKKLGLTSRYWLQKKRATIDYKAPGFLQSNISKLNLKNNSVKRHQKFTDNFRQNDYSCNIDIMNKSQPDLFSSLPKQQGQFPQPTQNQFNTKNGSRTANISPTRVKNSNSTAKTAFWINNHHLQSSSANTSKFGGSCTNGFKLTSSNLGTTVGPNSNLYKGGLRSVSHQQDNIVNGLASNEQERQQEANNIHHIDDWVNKKTILTKNRPKNLSALTSPTKELSKNKNMFVNLPGVNEEMMDMIMRGEVIEDKKNYESKVTHGTRVVCCNFDTPSNNNNYELLFEIITKKLEKKIGENPKQYQKLVNTTEIKVLAAEFIAKFQVLQDIFSAIANLNQFYQKLEDQVDLYLRRLTNENMGVDEEFEANKFKQLAISREWLGDFTIRNDLFEGYQKCKKTIIAIHVRVGNLKSEQYETQLQLAKKVTTNNENKLPVSNVTRYTKKKDPKEELKNNLHTILNLDGNIKDNNIAVYSLLGVPKSQMSSGNFDLDGMDEDGDLCFNYQYPSRHHFNDKEKNKKTQKSKKKNINDKLKAKTPLKLEGKAQKKACLSSKKKSCKVNFDNSDNDDNKSIISHTSINNLDPELNNFDSDEKPKHFKAPPSINNLDIGMKVTDLNRLIMKKKRRIEEDGHMMGKQQNTKKIYKFRLKILYTNFLKEPLLAQQRGLNIEDIIIFQRHIGISVNYSDLWSEFVNEEKEYVMSSTDLKIKWLSLTGKTDECLRCFSLGKTTIKKMIDTGFKFKLHDDSNHVSKEFATLLNKSAKISEDRIERELKLMKMGNIKTMKPLKAFDIRTGIVTTKWVHDDSTATENELMRKETMSQINPASFKLKESQFLLENQYDSQKHIKEKLVKELRNRVSVLRDDELYMCLTKIRQHLIMFFGDKEGQKVYLEIIVTQASWDLAMHKKANNLKVFDKKIKHMDYKLNNPVIDKLRDSEKTGNNKDKVMGEIEAGNRQSRRASHLYPTAKDIEISKKNRQK